MAVPGGPRYRPELDGVRALAVVGVLAFHGGMTWMTGGFLGVDAFFVLSGYLITSLLVAEWLDSGRIGLLAFWGRRARRLLPALLLVLLAVALAARAFLPDSEVRLLRGDGLAALFYVANWRAIVSGGDYFEQFRSPSPLEHTWSLGIEEQFYLAWPLVLLACLVLVRSLRALLIVCFGGFVASAAAMALLYDASDPGRAYYGTDARAASLLLGAALATALVMRRAEPPRRSARVVLSVLALLAVSALAVAWTQASGDDAFLYRGGLAGLAAAVTLVLAHVTLLPQGFLARTLSAPPLPQLGRISYGIYLWHWPVFLAANAERTGLEGRWLFALRLVLTLVLAIASYHLVEEPIRAKKWPRAKILTLTVAATSVATCAALIVAMTAVPRAQEAALELTKSDGLDRVADPPETDPPRKKKQRPIRRVKKGETAIVDVFGDSVAWSLVAYLPSHPDLDVRDRTSLGCGISPTAPYRYFGQTYEHVMDKCRDWQDRWKRAVGQDDPHVAVILVGRWETMDRVLDGRWTNVGEPAFDRHLLRQLHTAITIAGARGARVVLATEPYNRRGEQPDGSIYPEDEPSRVTRWNELVRQAVASHPGVRLLDFGARVSPDGKFTWEAGGVQVRADGLHLSVEGVQEWIAPWLFRELLAAVAR